MDSTVLRYIQLAHMTPIHYADDYYTSSKVADLYIESTLSDIFIEGIDSIIWHSFQQCWDTRPRADVTSIAFKAHLLLAIQKGPSELTITRNQAISRKQFQCIDGTSHLLRQSGINRQRRVHVRLNIAQDLFWSCYLHPGCFSLKIGHTSTFFDASIARCIRLRGTLKTVSLVVKVPCTTRWRNTNTGYHT